MFLPMCDLLPLHVGMKYILPAQYWTNRKVFGRMPLEAIMMCFYFSTYFVSILMAMHMG